MKQHIKLTESELTQVISKAINESMEESWQNIVFPTKDNNLGINELNLAIDGLKQSDKLIQQFKQSKNNFNLLQQAFEIRANCYKTIARASNIGTDVSQISDELLHIGPTEQGSQNQTNMAKDWKTAEKEINQVVKGNFNNWPAKCKQAGWSDEKIAAYREMASNPKQNPAGVQAMRNARAKQNAAQTPQTQQQTPQEQTPQATTTQNTQAPQTATTTPTGIPYANPQANQTPQQTTAWGTPMSNLQQQNNNLKESITRAIKSNLKKLK